MSEVQDLVFELGTEELPPKQLAKLASSLADNMAEGLKKLELDFKSCHWYASPRRLAVYVESLQVEQAAKEELRRGPAVSAAFDENGNPSKAAEGFARSVGSTVDKLETLETDKGKWLALTVKTEAKHCRDMLADIIHQACQKLPIARRMRWGAKSFEFVRPVHWSLLLLGNETIKIEILGTTSSNISFGHRFHAPGPIEISHAKDYKQQLHEQGCVMVDYEARKQHIQSSVLELATEKKATAVINPALLDEVTSINEWPHAVAGDFDAAFLKLPAEVLISTMQDHQKYFPLENEDGQLLPHFITIANLDSRNVDSIKLGNERVLAPRLSDARFFWQQDLHKALHEYRPGLDNVLYQKQLGSLGDKSRRVARLAGQLADMLGADKALCERAAELAKCDLLTDVVGEFPDLQGIIGQYYALESDEPAAIATAMNEQYMPRFAGDELPGSLTGQVLALADKLDTLTGIFSIGQIPTGDKDPFALRRNALGILRILVERKLDLNLMQLIEQACDSFQHDFDKSKTQSLVYDFCMDRLKHYYQDNGIDVHSIDSVLSLRLENPLDISIRLNAVLEFQKIPEAGDLAAANKRIQNILKKNARNTVGAVDSALLTDSAEQQLVEQIEASRSNIAPLLKNGNYLDSLNKLAALRDPIDRFFDEVMVMADDEKLKQNRLALLDSVKQLFLEVADISRLQGG